MTTLRAPVKEMNEQIQSHAKGECCRSAHLRLLTLSWLAQFTSLVFPGNRLSTKV